MQLRAQDLRRALASGLARSYLLWGEEPLLLLEAADAVRAAARAAGFTERLVFDCDPTFDYRELSASAQARSLFAERRILDVRLPSAKPGRDGSAVLAELAASIEDDTLLMVTTGKLDRASLAATWVKALDAAGVLVACWPIGPRELPAWLEQRMRGRALAPEREAVLALAERVEGNLLAAAQEIDKLHLLQGPGPVTGAQICEQVADSARFQLFVMIDTALAGRADRAVRMARSLRAEGAPVAVVSSVLAREVRLLARLADRRERGGSLQPIYQEARVWDTKRGLLERALGRAPASRWRDLVRGCADLDRAVKGLDPRDPWLLTERLLVAVAAGREPGRAPADASRSAARR